jgi:hypothetical protein
VSFLFKFSFQFLFSFFSVSLLIVSDERFAAKNAGCGPIMRRQSTPFASEETTGFTAESLKALVAQRWLDGVSRRLPVLDLRARKLVTEHMKILQAKHRNLYMYAHLTSLLRLIAFAERVARRHDGAQFGE